MKKLLAAATVAVIALVVLLWMQLRTPEAAAQASAKAPSAAAAAPTAHPQAAALADVAKKVAAAESAAQKLDPASDAFFYKFDEQVPPQLTAAAATCYQGGLHRVHRNAKVKLGYTIRIKDSVLSVSNIHVIESTVNDKALEDCFAREVAKVTWKDDELPDWQQDDELVIRPERGMKKFTAENLNYEGEGPIGKLESSGDVAASRELPR